MLPLGLGPVLRVVADSEHRLVTFGQGFLNSDTVQFFIRIFLYGPFYKNRGSIISDKSEDR